MGLPIKQPKLKARRSVGTLQLNLLGYNHHVAVVLRFVSRLRYYARSSTKRDNVFVSVASDKPESQAFFQKHGFVSKDQIEVAYQEGNIETIYTKELKYNDTI